MEEKETVQEKVDVHVNQNFTPHPPPPPPTDFVSSNEKYLAQPYKPLLPTNVCTKIIMLAIVLWLLHEYFNLMD